MQYIEVTAPDLVIMAEKICSGGKYTLTAMFANDERRIQGYFAIYCIFAGEGQFTALKVILPQHAKLEFPSLTTTLQLAAWYEREIHDLFGIVPLGHPDLRRLVLHENWPQDVYPLRKDFAMNQLVPDANTPYPMAHVQGEGVFEVPVGPIHAGIIEPGHFRFTQSGEQVIHLDAKLFFTHRGIEKGLEGLSVDNALYQVERICGACSVSHAISYSQAIERMAQITIPPRAQFIRGLIAELERLYNHVGDVGNLCAGLGFAVGTSHGARLKEMLMRLNERVVGNRFLRGMVIVGGVRLDVTPELAEDIRDVLGGLVSEFDEMVEIIRDNSAFADRINQTGILPRAVAFELGVVGVAARASGINHDMRRDHPYGIYNQLSFKVPVETTGDVAARLWVRVAEVDQSIQIIREILGKMSYDPAELRVNIPIIKPYNSELGWSESARGSNIHWVMMGEHNTIYRYAVRSASYPNWPAVTLATPGNIIPDFPLINKSFELCYACIDR